MFSTLESPNHLRPGPTPFSRGSAFADRVLQEARPESLLRSAVEAFGDGLVLTTAFGLEGSVLVDMVGRLGLPIRIVTLDTGLFFSRTHETWRRLEARHGLRIEALRPRMDLAKQAASYGEALWERAPDLCCQIRKVEPLRELLSEATAWITGLRRDQTPERAATPRVGQDGRFGVVKISPLAHWSVDQVRAYLETHRVPYNPMFDEGYPSIGCEPCTSQVEAGEDPRAGRWKGHDKRECGLHWDASGALVRLGARP
ncbi:MAG: phosphoadenylyl-sulfate reductase [Myxococcota bacterium]